MNCSLPFFLVPHNLPECAYIHVHCISDAIQPSHPLSPPSPLALSLSQHHFTDKVHVVKAMVFPVVVYVWELDHKEGLSAKELMLLNCDAGEDF